MGSFDGPYIECGGGGVDGGARRDLVRFSSYLGEILWNYSKVQFMSFGRGRRWPLKSKLLK